MGHEDIEMTLGTYGYLYPNYNKKILVLSQIISMSKEIRTENFLIYVIIEV